MSSSAATTPDPDPGHADDRVAAGLADVLRETTGAGSIEIGDLVRIPAGASRQTWSFVATIDGKPRRLVLRLDPPGDATRRRCFARPHSCAPRVPSGCPRPR